MTALTHRVRTRSNISPTRYDRRERNSPPVFSIAGIIQRPLRAAGIIGAAALSVPVLSYLVSDAPTVVTKPVNKPAFTIEIDLEDGECVFQTDGGSLISDGAILPIEPDNEVLFESSEPVTLEYKEQNAFSIPRTSLYEIDESGKITLRHNGQSNIPVEGEEFVHSGNTLTCMTELSDGTLESGKSLGF